MFKNNIKISIRNLIKNKFFTAINIFGLAIGIASSILIFLWIQDELNFDNFHKNLQNNYRLLHINEDSEKSTITPPPLSPKVCQNIPEITNYSRFASWSTRKIHYDNKLYNEKNHYFVDPGFFEMFSFELLKGSADEFFKNPNTIILTESSSEKYFGNSDPMGKILKVDSQFSVTVVGVMKNIPKNSSIEFDMLSPFSLFVNEIIGKEQNESWDFNMLSSFVQLSPNSDINAVNAKLKQNQRTDDVICDDFYSLQPFNEIHLYSSNFDRSTDNLGNIKYLWVFSILSLFITLIACLNFMNLSTARAAKRAREVGIRKVLGSHRSALILKFLIESIIVTFISMLFALIIIEAVLPFFNQFTGKTLSINLFQNVELLLTIIFVGSITSLVSGSYPSFYLSAFEPTKVLKSDTGNFHNRINFRHVLVTAQFAISIALIIGTWIITQQLKYIAQKDLGFRPNQLIDIRLSSDHIEKYNGLKNELLNNPNIENVTASLALPINNGNTPGVPKWEGKTPDNKFDIRAEMVDFDYTETFGINILEGRSFSRSFATDDSAAYIVNEAAVKAMNMENPVGKAFSFWNIEGNIIGVMEDYHFRPMYKKIEPMVLKINSSMFRRVIIKIKSENIPGTIASIENTWKSVLTDSPFEYRFIDEYFETMYESEMRMETLFKVFAFLAIFIACLGLFGLASYTAEQKRKEIGIRKVLGASVSVIVVDFAKQFLKWIVLANLIAWPLIWLTMNKWLNSFAYKTEISIWIFVISGCIALMIALITISFQAFKTAISDPIKSLRYE